MDIRISREEGHAHVGAIRVLQYRLGRPPTPAEVAEVLGSKEEITRHRLRALEQLGIVRLVENPFETHASVADHVALDDDHAPQLLQSAGQLDEPRQLVAALEDLALHAVDLVHVVL